MIGRGARDHDQREFQDDTRERHRERERDPPRAHAVGSGRVAVRDGERDGDRHHVVDPRIRTHRQRPVRQRAIVHELGPACPRTEQREQRRRHVVRAADEPSPPAGGGVGKRGREFDCHRARDHLHRERHQRCQDDEPQRHPGFGPRQEVRSEDEQERGEGAHFTHHRPPQGEQSTHRDECEVENQQDPADRRRRLPHDANRYRCSARAIERERVARPFAGVARPFGQRVIVQSNDVTDAQVGSNGALRIQCGNALPLERRPRRGHGTVPWCRERRSGGRDQEPEAQHGQGDRRDAPNLPPHGGLPSRQDAEDACTPDSVKASEEAVVVISLGPPSPATSLRRWLVRRAGVPGPAQTN